MNFSGSGFATSSLANLATNNTSGVALYNDAGGTPGSFDGTDAVITLASNPAFSGNNFILTPATAPSLPNGAASIFYVAVKTSSSLVNNVLIAATVPASGVMTSDGNGPTADFTINNLRADTAPASIISVGGSSASGLITVKFNKPVQKVGGGNLTASDFVYTDGAGSHKHSNVSHTASLQILRHLPGGNLDAVILELQRWWLDPKNCGHERKRIGCCFDPVSFLSTAVIPNVTVGSTYASSTPLLVLSASGGTISSGYKWRANSSTDAATLASIGLNG